MRMKRCHALDIDDRAMGLPEWLAVVQSALLNESATLFRRRYYTNGSHAGFILYMTDPQPEGMDVDALRQALRDSRGPGNFRNLFVHSPRGKKDGLQLIPISEVAAKDEFTGIKRVTRDDILVALRVPPAAARHRAAECGRLRFDSGCGHGVGVDGAGSPAIAHGHGQRVDRRGGHYLRPVCLGAPSKLTPCRLRRSWLQQ